MGTTFVQLLSKLGKTNEEMLGRITFVWREEGETFLHDHVLWKHPCLLLINQWLLPLPGRGLLVARWSLGVRSEEPERQHYFNSTGSCCVSWFSIKNRKPAEPDAGPLGRTITPSESLEVIETHTYSYHWSPGLRILHAGCHLNCAPQLCCLWAAPSLYQVGSPWMARYATRMVASVVLCSQKHLL